MNYRAILSFLAELHWTLGGRIDGGDLAEARRSP